jgi:hypothetical protein
MAHFFSLCAFSMSPLPEERDVEGRNVNHLMCVISPCPFVDWGGGATRLPSTVPLVVACARELPGVSASNRMDSIAIPMDLRMVLFVPPEFENQEWPPVVPPELNEMRIKLKFFEVGQLADQYNG